MATKLEKETERHNDRLAKIEQRRVDKNITDEQAATQVADENERHDKIVASISPDPS